MKIEKFVPKHILDITPYSLDADFPKNLSKKYTRLSLNENLIVERDFILNLISSSLNEIDPRLYPEPHGKIAVRAISKFLNIDESNIFVGNGLDDVLERISRVFITTGTKVAIIEPTFTIYSYYIKLCNGIKVPIMLKDNFELDVDRTLKVCENGVKLLFLCSPNSPTGNQFDEKDVNEILSKFNGITIIDETYSDFGRYSVCKWLDDFENLIVLKSFSKAYGLAGVRIGYMLANKNIVDIMKKSVHPFNVNSISQRVVETVLEKYKYFKENIDYLKTERERLKKDLQGISGVTVYPSDTNFMLFRVDKRITSLELQSKLKDMGMIIKDRGTLPLLENCLRMTIGTKAMNSNLINALKTILEINGKI